MALERGAVYRYSYLWAREADAGEEGGRKDRPACLLLRPSNRPDLLVMFAITSQMPAANRVAEKLTPGDCARCGLREPAWIVLDEYNICIMPALHDFVSLDPVGKLSSGYLKIVAAKARDAIKSGRARGVLRN